MTTGTINEVSVVETLPDGWKLYQRRYKVWNGVNSAKPPTPAKVMVPVFQPGVYRFRKTKKGQRDNSEILGYSYIQVKPPRIIGKKQMPISKKAPRTNNPYTSYVKQVREDWFDCKRNGSGRYSGVIGEVLPQSSDLNWSSDDDYRMLAKLQERLVGSTWNAGVTVGEAKEAIGLIGSVASRMYKTFRCLKRGDIAGAVYEVKNETARSGLNLKASDPGSAYLTYIWGVKPLLKDVYDAAQFLGYTSSAPRRTTVRNIRHAGGVPYRFITKQVWGFTPSSNVCVDLLIYESKRIKCVVSEVDILGMAGLKDPASVAWEMLPWSQIADWFLPIGTYLSAMNFLRNVQGEFVTSYRVESRGVNPRVINTSSDIFTFSRPPSNWGSESVSLTRTVGTGMAIPKPKMKKATKIASFDHAMAALASIAVLAKPKTRVF